MGISDLDPDAHGRRPWNAGNMVGAKRPLKPRDVWAIRFFLDEHRRLRDRALFDLAIDSKLRGCDIVKMKIGDIASGGVIRNRATVMQQKTKRPVQFELMTEARQTLFTWLNRRGGTVEDFIFPSRVNYMGHLSTRQYARLVDKLHNDNSQRHHPDGTGIVSQAVSYVPVESAAPHYASPRQQSSMRRYTPYLCHAGYDIN